MFEDRKSTMKLELAFIQGSCQKIFENRRIFKIMSDIVPKLSDFKPEQLLEGLASGNLNILKTNFQPIKDYL